MKALSLQGGGILGYGQSIMLSKLEDNAGKQCFQIFDIIGGTSIGSIIGAHLAVGISTKQIKSFFVNEGPNLFKGSILNKIAQIYRPKYDGRPIEEVLQKCLGDKTLSDCKTKFVATSYDWASNRPVYFKSYEKSYQTKDYIVIGYDEPIKLWQVCRASSAAQTYFPAFVYKDLVLIDGGNIGDNDPDMLVVAEAAEYLASLNCLSMLSLGAGETKWEQSPKAMISPSILSAGLKTINILFSAGESSEVYKASKILGNRYKRVSPDLDKGYSIDDASPVTLSQLRVAAERAIRANPEVFGK